MSRSEKVGVIRSERLDGLPDRDLARSLSVKLFRSGEFVGVRNILVGVLKRRVECRINVSILRVKWSVAPRL